MSKLAVLNQYRYSPAAGGGIFGAVIGGVAKFIGKGLGIIKPVVSKAAQVAAATAKTPAGQAALAAGAGAMAGALMRPGGGKAGGAGATGTWRRRRRGITALELRGYRKVARLLHQEGMVSRRARGRK